MAELPFELQKLPGSALDLLRYFGRNDNQPADNVTLADATDLSDRALSKAIKRLVTRKFAEMDVHRRYSLTDKGLQLMEELLAFDENNGGPAQSTADEDDDLLEEPADVRLSLVVPEPLVAGLETKVYVGVEDGLPSGEADLTLRVSTINAEPKQTDVPMNIGSGPAYTSFSVTPGEFTAVRLRLEVLQADNFSGDMHHVGGMYVDVDVTSDPEEAGQLAAFGADATVMP